MESDVRRVILAAARAAVDEASAPPPKKVKKLRIPAKRALLVGAGLVTAARLTSGGRARHLLGSLKERVGDLDDRLRDDDQDEDEEELAPEEELDEDEEDLDGEVGQHPGDEDEADRDR